MFRTGSMASSGVLNLVLVANCYVSLGISYRENNDNYTTSNMVGLHMFYSSGSRDTPGIPGVRFMLIHYTR